MSEIKFTHEEKALIVQKVNMYFREELDSEIGGFDAEFLIDFFSKEVGSYYYNRGVYDAQALVTERVESLAESLFELEKPLGT